MAEQRNNSGAIFRNDKREKDTHPHAKGSCMIDGVEYWVSAWKKTSQSGTDFTSLSFTRKDSQPVSAPKAEPTLEAPVFPPDSSEELPF